MQQQTQRSGVIVGVLSLAMLVGAALTSSPAQADTGAGPYYAQPAWDRTLPSAGRFLVLTNFGGAAVLDRETGLVWEKSPLTTVVRWDISAGFSESALVQCTSRTTGGRKGWRLPSVHELASLVDPANSNPSLPTGHPFTNVLSAGYWSATTVADNPYGAWLVRFGNGDVDTVSKGGSELAWCVRGGMNADAY